VVKYERNVRAERSSRILDDAKWALLPQTDAVVNC
jgi:hypothetical protein